MVSTPPVSPRTPAPQAGFNKALTSFKNRLTPSEAAQFQVVTLDDLKVTILAIQADQRARKQMMHMDRILSFLEAMDQFGKVIETFLNVSEMLAFIWGPIKFLLLTATTWLESFDALLDAYQLIAESLPIFEIYQDLFSESSRMQGILECIWTNILDFHIRAIRIFDQSMIKLFFRSLWKDFNSRFQHIISDLQRQKALIESHANQIHICNYESDRVKIREEFEQARASRAAEKKAYVLQWIMAPKTVLDHESLCSVRREQLDITGQQTAQWILKNNEVEAWLASQVPKSSTVWLSGIAGAGKSVLTSVIVDEIKEKDLGPMAFFYCKHRDPDKNTFISVAKALLSQLLNQQDHLMPFYYDEGIRSGESSLHSMKLCKKLLRAILQAIPVAFLVIDGIDECDSNERKSILTFLSDIINLCDNNKPGKIRLFISSRDESDIRRALLMGTRIKLDRRDTIQDLNVYIEHRASELQRKFGLSAEAQRYIQQNVLDKSDGMFLYAKLVMANLEGQPTLHHLHEEFDSLPSGLEEAYGRNLYRIKTNSNKSKADVARRILLLMVCARRPLRWRELQAAISISPDDLALDIARRLPQDSDVTEMCGSLVEVLPGDRVEFIHITASLYIVDLGYSPLFEAEHAMAMLCLYYLAFEYFEEDRGDDDILQLIRKGYYAFQDYAAAHWADHFLAMLSTPETITQEWFAESTETSNALTIFADRFHADLAASSTVSKTPPDYSLFSSLGCFPAMTMIWKHAEPRRLLIDDRRDNIGLVSLGKSIERNRHVLEEHVESITDDGAETTALEKFYGANWFKCTKASCYYFHEGFNSRASRQQHYDRHERPFRCDEENCPAARIGFGSLKELEKHKRNVHPGIDKLSSTFARFKRGSKGQAVLLKYLCPRCPLKFATRLQCRSHMTSHNPIIHPKHPVME
ncbi:uncharacterized protein F4817DRAFT_336508 [Daldinia loculata]|uniref:uncharacterized protein n=1 Tax=Daldinia loculata TaxID=103429 RepID=UPI0020C25541|nr:uncharacterized protein F4817DRAFT_336508 [Daldinia loculata]KAI1647683.1 hypothetical protein F4817DRAFT_336508 [Daldinia loculata]